MCCRHESQHRHSLSAKLFDLVGRAVRQGLRQRLCGDPSGLAEEEHLFSMSAARRRATFRTLAATRPCHTKLVLLRELFLPLLGNWTGVEQQAASPGGPATAARAMIVFKLDVGDQVVVQDYRQVSADRAEFSGHGVFMIDRADPPATAPRTTILWWFFDSEGYPPQPAHGAWQNSELIMHRPMRRGIAEHRFAVADEQLSYLIRVNTDNAAEPEELLRGTYRRFSGH
jgi:hypothetical protein